MSLQALDDGRDVADILDGGRGGRGRPQGSVRSDAVGVEVVAVPTIAPPVAVVFLVGEVVIDAIRHLKYLHWTGKKRFGNPTPFKDGI